jgi:hypothetical protein
MTSKRYTIATTDTTVGTVATWDEAVELARGYWGTTPSIRATEAASGYSITVHGDYVGTLLVENADDVELARFEDATRKAAELVDATGAQLVRDWATLATGGTFVSPAVELDADQLADEAELAELLLQREAHAARLAAFDAERIVVGDGRTPCDVVGCIAAAAGRWDIVARPTSYRDIPLCRAHVAEHRAAPQVSAVRPHVAD